MLILRFNEGVILIKLFRLSGKFRFNDLLGEKILIVLCGGGAVLMLLQLKGFKVFLISLFFVCY